MHPTSTESPNGVAATFQPLPGDEDYVRRYWQNAFEEVYGKDANFKQLYAAQPGNFLRFSRMFPRMAFLLDKLKSIHAEADILMDVFKENYRLAVPDNALTSQPLYFHNLDPFEYFSSSSVEFEHRSCLLHLRAALDKRSDVGHGPIFRETARDILHHFQTSGREAIVAELLSAEAAAELDKVRVSKNTSIWVLRRELQLRENMVANDLERIQHLLNQHERSNADIVEYGQEPVASFLASPMLARPHGRSSIRSPERRDPGFETLVRSSSWDSAGESGASVATWAPVEPDNFTMSIKVWSAAKNTWIEAIAVMDTGCEGGNFVSSTFLEEELGMHEHAVDDADAHRVQWVDFAGKTDFKPRGKVELKWYGRHIESGRRGKRTIETTSWFRVAPHLESESGEQPFEVLLGKDFLHENEIIQYRGLRLFKSRVKKSDYEVRLDEVELLRRQQLRSDIEHQRRNRRLSNDGASTASPNLSMRSSDASLVLSDLSIRSRTDSDKSGTVDQSNPTG